MTIIKPTATMAHTAPAIIPVKSLGSDCDVIVSSSIVSSSERIA